MPGHRTDSDCIQGQVEYPICLLTLIRIIYIENETAPWGAVTERARQDSNLRPLTLQASALSAELRTHGHVRSFYTESCVS
jgi:hypothetical protein